MREKAYGKGPPLGYCPWCWLLAFPSWCEVSVRCDEGFEGKVPVLHAKGRETKMTILPFGPSLMDEVLYLRPVIKGKGAPKAGFIIQEGESSYGT